ncbi:MAG: phosphomannomutase/phosphoglucomutase [Magnetococcales bacterium]|nr:phosphomannomutase/phosphoglucomutase [Magnetococcales bacterium]
MNGINPHSFREYDIRGVVDEDLTEEFARTLGQAFACHVRESLGIKTPTVAVGRDGRASSPRLSAALIEGLNKGGASVVDVGMGPTPMLYFAVHHFDANAGIMVTGSHNPPEYNGLKMVKDGKPVYGAEIQALKDRMLQGRLEAHSASARRENIMEIYLDRITRDFRPGRPIKVILDCGNGAGGAAAPGMMQRLTEHVESEVMYAEVDGTFPNHHPDPTIPKYLKDLKKRVLETGADLGIAFDGDGDRIGALDEKGEIIWGDRLMILFGRDLLKERPGATIIGDVKCSQVLFDAIEQAGGTPLMWKTGHSLVKSKMRETKAPLGGEMSGHLFFADRYYGYDDALYAAVRLMSVLAAEDSPMSERLLDLPEVFATPELRIECPDEIKFQVMERVLQAQKDAGEAFSDIDGVRVKKADGWWLLRVSNTQPALVCRVEAQSEVSLVAIETEVTAILNREGVSYPDWRAE